MVKITRKLGLLAVAATLLACATPPAGAPARSDDNADTQAPQSVSAAVNETTPPVPEEYGNFTEEQLFEAIVSELGGQRGNLPEASERYYRLAFETRDLGIVRRATQFASVSGDLNAVVQLGLLWTEISPRELEPHLMLSYHLLEAGRFEDAVNHMARIIELGGEMDFSAISRRTQRLSADRRAGLISNLRDLHELYPDEDSLHFTIVELLDQNQQTQDALIELQALRQSYGDSAPTYLIEAQLLEKLQQSERSLRSLRDGLRKFPQDKPLRFTYARALIQLEDYTAARREFQTLVDQDPEDYETLYSIALLDVELEEFDEAKEYFSRLLGVNHRPDESHYYLGFIHEEQGALDEAIRHYRSVQIGSSNFVAAQQQATRLAIQQERYQEAHDWLVNLSRGQPRLDVVFTSIEASALMAAGQLDLAGLRLDEALERYPTDLDLLFSRVLLHDARSDMVAAEQDLRRIIAANPQDSRALNHLGYMLADRTTRYEEAMELLERAIAISPDDPAIIDSVAWAQYKLGRYEEALTNLRRAYAAFPDHEVASHLGEVLWVMGRKDEAMQVWTDALKERPDSELLKNVMQRFNP
ncbi:MAG: hypothetical protein RLZZ385_2815 [Pseudomonadota bacterium]|jgi:tetratricopeptide (TPR) repeat protein